jgi:hypothetical protein
VRQDLPLTHVLFSPHLAAQTFDISTMLSSTSLPTRLGSPTDLRLSVGVGDDMHDDIGLAEVVRIFVGPAQLERAWQFWLKKE